MLKMPAPAVRDTRYRHVLTQYVTRGETSQAAKQQESARENGAFVSVSLANISLTNVKNEKNQSSFFDTSQAIQKLRIYDEICIYERKIEQ